MNDIDAYLYPVALDASMQSQVGERIRTFRATTMDSLLGQLQTPETSARLGAERASCVQGFINELLELAQHAPEQLTELMSHWGSFALLNAISAPATRVETQLDNLLGNLQALLIGRYLRGQGISPQVRFTTPPRAYDLRRNVLLEVPGAAAGQKVEWSFSQGSLALRHGDTTLPATALPLGAGGPVSERPLTWSKSWNIPLIDENALLGITGTTPQELQKEVADPDFRPLSLHDSAEAAYTIVRDLWPEMLDWSPQLFTALVDMNGPPTRHVHRSASYGPGSPIFVTRVDDAFKHAEDIVHELQHQRMSLIMDTSAFGTWDDPRQIAASPYRSDPRPLRGLHLGIHAFLAVNRLRLRQHARAGFPADRFRYMLNAHRTNLFSFRTLLHHEDIREHGRPMFAEYARELVAQHELIEPMVTREQNESFDHHMREHIAAVAGRASEKLINMSPEYMDWNETARLAARYAEKEGVS
ncbi:HEXXH motif-containing putative peptide modification protein [Myxococcus sp. K15C18031901]|uniref:aKG-HExxH-type peptide beta-hydroxylase n=1 Tax=Myxococcus dinghuensis TaxID=2906761 RepID=UPI0020A7C52E|nr:HEXXH motif-containing putative peptide modification protein [Myxococcus dinghuensis]MCP3102943.1 HEXXH motif-containing putative peptide modification protein [Myxococcus dinghuensis]